MTDRARELVERLRARTVPVMGGAGLYEVVLNERADGLCNEAADFIEQSLTPPVSEGVVERVRLAIGNAGRETFVNSLGYCVMRGMLVVDPETTKEQADALLREAAERAIIAALQSRVSPQAGMREALEEAREAIESLDIDVLGWADMSDRYTGDAVDYPIRDELLAKIDAALSTDPIPSPNLSPLHQGGNSK